MGDTNDSARRDRQQRVEERKAEAMELSGGTTRRLYDELTKAGLELPEPASIDDEQLTRKLWEVINALADMGNYLESTDHLSDRQLYTVLYERVLPEEYEDDEIPGVGPGSWHIDILGGCSEEDIYLRMKYYADEKWRTDFLEEFPDYLMPPHEDPPYDRDSKLPVAFTD